jgi:hypothetical protein
VMGRPGEVGHRHEGGSMKPSIILGALIALAAFHADAANSVVEYKGRHIQVAADGSGAQCLALVRQAIDLTAELAPKQRSLAAEVKDLRCTPMPDEKRTNAVAHNTIGLYTMQSPDIPGGYIRFPLQPKNFAAAEATMSLVGNGGYARWHRAYLAAKQHAAGDPRAAATVRKYQVLLTRSDPKAVLMAECEFLENDHAAILALGLGERRASYVGRQMMMRGCP